MNCSGLIDGSWVVCGEGQNFCSEACAAVHLLSGLLDHPIESVRIAAVYGLSELLEGRVWLHKKWREVEATDPSSRVRTAAAFVLLDFATS